MQILADSVFTAHWTANTYTVTLNPDGGTVSSTTVMAVYGAPVILPAAEKEGYIFEGWYLGDTQYASGGIYEIAGNVTLTAHWEEEFSGYVVTLNPGGGTVSPAELEVEPGDTYTLPVPTKTGYTFAGWYLGESQIQTGDTVELEADAVFTAHWTANSYTIVFHGNGGNYFFDTEQTQACVYDQDVTLNGNQFTRLFYAFEGWSTTETGTVEYTDQQSGLRNLTAEANGQFHLYAVWRNTWEWSSAESPAMLTSLEEEPLLTYTKAYTYDLAGNRTGMTVSVGGQTAQTVTYTYDDLNRLTGVSEDGTLKAAYTYDTNGNRQSLTYANGVVESYSYNKANWVTGVVNQKDGEVLSSYTYTYYASGNQKSKTDHTGKTTSYEYDGLGRLTLESEAGGITASYVYDLKGNRLSLTVTGTESYTTAYSYDANNRLLSETRTESGESVVTTYTYDSNGNLLTESTPAHGEEPASNSSYVYDDMDRLVKATVNGVAAFYTYNPSGIRTSKRIGGGTAVNYLLDGGDVIGESENGVITAEYLRGLNLILGEEGYYLYNAHGDVVGLTDESGEVTKAYDYDAFGNEKELNANDQNPFRYCGEYFDLETGTYYLRARYYDPAIGRFTQEDTHWNVANRIYGDNPQILYEHQDAFGLVIYSYIPNIIAVMQSGNSYLYCLGNPSTFIDNNGYFINTIIGGITGGVVGGFMAAMTGGDFSSGFISGAVSGAFSGLGVDVAVATGGMGLIWVPILGAAGGFFGDITGQILSGSDDVNLTEALMSAGTGAIFNTMSYGLAVLSSSAFGSVPRGNTVMEKMVNSVVDSTVPENTLSAWMSTNFVELPQVVTDYTIDQSRSRQQPAVVNTAEQNKVNKKKTNSYSKKNNKNQIRY